MPTVSALCRQLLEHVLLVGLWLEVEEADRAGWLTAEGFAAERDRQRLTMLDVVRVVALELAVGPKRLEVSDGTGKQRLLRTLGQLDSPLQAACQRCAREVGAAHVGRAETRLALEQPGLRVQACAAAIEGNANLAPWQARQFIERARLGRAGVRRGQDAQPRSTLALCARGRDLLQHVLQLTDPGYGDEADQDVDLIGRGQFAPDLLKQRRRALAGSEQPGNRETNLGRYLELPIALHGTQNAQRLRHQVDDFGGAACRARAFCRGEPVPKHHQQLVDQLELSPGLVGVVTGNVIQDRAELARYDIDQ